MAISCPNLSDPVVKEQFEQIRQATVHESIAYDIWNDNKGNPIDKAPNGNNSLLYKDLLHFAGSHEAATKLKTQAFTSRFKQKFGDWTQGQATELVDENGEPLAIYFGDLTGPREVVISRILDREFDKKSSEQKLKIRSEFNKYISDLKEYINTTPNQIVAQALKEIGNDWKKLIIKGFTDRAFAQELNSIHSGEEADIPYRNQSFWERLKKFLLGIISDTYTKFDALQDLVEDFFEIKNEELADQQIAYSKSNDLKIKMHQLGGTINPSVQEAIETNDQLEKNKIFQQVEPKMKAFLNSVGVRYEGKFDDIRDRYGNPINAVAKADLLAKVVEVIENKRDISTLPEEAAHIFVKLLPPTHPLYVDMMNRITSYQIYEDVKKAYGELYGYDETKIREEAIGKLISIHVLSENANNPQDPTESVETENNINVLKRWFNKVMEFFGKMFKNSPATQLNPFVESAKLMLENNVQNLRTLDDAISEAREKGFELTYYQLAPEEIQARDELIKKFENPVLKIDPVNQGYMTLDGVVVSNRVSNYVKDYYRKLFRNTQKEAEFESNLAAHKGTYLHKLSQLIMEDLSKGVNKAGLYNYSNFENYRRTAVREITEAVPEFSKNVAKFTDLTPAQYAELVGGVVNIFDQIQRNATTINKSIGTNMAPKIFTEQMIYDPVQDLAGTIDVMVVYPNGTVAIYDYKGIIFKEYGGEVEDIPFYKIEAYDIQISKYKQILTEAYGVKNFAETRILPINMQFVTKDGKMQPEGFFKLEFGAKGNKDYLQQIPVANELTHDKDLNKSLEKMFNYRKTLKLRLKKDYENKDLKERLYKIEKSIRKIQLEKDISFVYKEVALLYKEFLTRELASKSSPDFLDVDTLKELREYAEYFKMYSDFSINASNVLNELDNPELRASVEKIPHYLGYMQELIKQKLIEHVNLIDGTDITKDIKSNTSLGRMFKNLHDYKQPMFKKMAKLVQQSIDNKRRAVNEVVTEVMAAEAELKKWADSKGISVYDAYNKILNERKELVSQFDKSYWEEFREAKEKGDTKWILTNAVLNEEEMLRDRDAYIKILDSNYKDALDSTIKQKKLKLWDKKYNFVAEPKSALISKYNPYIQLKDNPARYSAEYKYIHEQGNEPLKKFYNMLIQYNEKFADITGKKIRRNFVAEVRKDTIDSMAEVGIFNALLGMKQSILNSMEVREFDVADRELGPDGKPIQVVPLLLTDKLRDKLSAKESQEISDALKKEGLKEGSMEYTNEFRRRTLRAEYEKGVKSKSIDLAKSLILFAETAYTNQFFTESEETIRALQLLVHSDVADTELVGPDGKKIIDKVKGTIAKKLGVASSDIEAFDKFVDYYWFGGTSDQLLPTFTIGKEVDESGKVITEGKTYSGDDVVRGLMKITSVKALAFKPILAGGNAIGIITNAFMLGAEGMHFTQPQLRKAVGKLLFLDKKALAANHFFEPSARNLVKEKANLASGSFLTRVLTEDNVFILHKKPDDFMDAAILISMMQNYGIDENGNVRRLARLPKGSQSLYDLSELNDKTFSVKGLSEEQADYFRKLVRQQGTAIKGSIPEDNKMLIEMTVAGNVLMQFRKWMPGLIKTRFGDVDYDEVTKELSGGRTRVLIGEIARSKGFQDILKTFTTLAGEVLISAPVVSRVFAGRTFYAKNQNLKAARYYYNKYITEHPEHRDTLSFEQYLEFREAKLKGAAKELSLLLAFIALTTLLKASIPDDDEKYVQQNFARNAYKMINRGLLELLFWYDPNTVTQIMNKPIVSITVFTDLFKLIGNTIDVTSDFFKDEKDPEKAVWKKGKKDKTPAFYYTSGMIPGLNAILDWFNVWDKPLPK